jgi:hypothetical protein
VDGPAGAGKSAIAQTVAAACAERKILAASYFFFRGSPSRNTITPLIPTIAHQIATSSPEKRRKLEKIIKDPSILHKALEVQLDKLILKPYRPSFFRRIFSFKRMRYLLIIDGLDECNGDDNQIHVLGLVNRLVSSEHCTIRCLIASRPEPHILSAVGVLTAKVARVTWNDKLWDANGDIRTYLRAGFNNISACMPPDVPRPWPSDSIIDTLVQKAGGIFIYAATVLKYVDDPDTLPTTQLQHVLKLSPGTAPFAQLDQLYKRILMGCLPKYRSILPHIFGFILLQNPQCEDIFDVSLIEAVLGLEPGEALVVLRKLHSILEIKTSDSKQTITFLHASIGDFVFNRERSGGFHVDRLDELLQVNVSII